MTTLRWFLLALIVFAGEFFVVEYMVHSTEQIGLYAALLILTLAVIIQEFQSSSCQSQREFDPQRCRTPCCCGKGKFTEGYSGGICGSVWGSSAGDTSHEREDCKIPLITTILHGGRS